MKTLAHRAWTEPAVAIALIVAALQVAQVLLIDNATANAVLAVALAAAGGAQTRARVTPTRRSPP